MTSETWTSQDIIPMAYFLFASFVSQLFIISPEEREIETVKELKSKKTTH